MIPDRSVRAQADMTLPVLLIGLAFVASLFVTTIQAVRDQRTLALATENQARATQEGERLRIQLQNLMAGATTIAKEGDTSAQSVLDALEKQGLKYTP